MDLSLTVLNQVLVMFALIAIGYFCFKIKLIDDSGKQQLTNLLLFVVNPMVVINAYQIDFNPQLANNLLIAFGLAVFSHILAMGIAYLFIQGKNNQHRASIERFSVIYTNCGFMALPLINALFGNEGVFYASAYVTIFNLLSWTHGYVTMSGKADKKAMLKSLVSPVVVSVFVGIIMFYLNLKLPFVLATTVSAMASLNTPLAMVVTGVSLAQTKILSAFKTLRCYYIVFLMNVLVPLCAMIIYLFLPLDSNLLIVNLVSTACPCAVTTLLFASKFDRDSAYASKLLTLSNVTCIVTIPGIIFLYQILSKLI
ncbi:AEC family transporter [Paludicola sp. MB14-C6]|uniref:AEC family transporter n=1 Tax=Paludihabitans sp. MB14-C6 TaxID=3070656 RepID=UPI0027DC2AE8|nr:AEC family transporter [Paludicola sp. MB14-C6]WMJ23807.1 AEC family transporter [Paludicola sp. MB14-C6]